jgi:hypothetical protein
MARRDQHVKVSFEVVCDALLIHHDEPSILRELSTTPFPVVVV